MLRAGRTPTSPAQPDAGRTALGGGAWRRCGDRDVRRREHRGSAERFAACCRPVSPRRAPRLPGSGATAARRRAQRQQVTQPPYTRHPITGRAISRRPRRGGSKPTAQRRRAHEGETCGPYATPQGGLPQLRSRATTADRRGLERERDRSALTRQCPRWSASAVSAVTGSPWRRAPSRSGRAEGPPEHCGAPHPERRPRRCLHQRGPHRVLVSEPRQWRAAMVPRPFMGPI